MAAQEIHHRVPQCLLGLRDAADAGEMDGAGLQVWLNYEMEAMLWGINPDIERNELAALIEDSTVLLSREEHRYGSESDFVRWGRRGRASHTQALRNLLVLAAGEEALAAS